MRNAIFIFTLFWSVSFATLLLPTAALAQNAPQVVLGQYIVSATSTVPAFTTTARLGAGWSTVGSTTSAVVSLQTTSSFPNGSDGATVILAGWSDSSYGTQVTQCQFGTYGTPTTPTKAYNGFVQLNHAAGFDVGADPCIMHPALYYTAEVSYTNGAHSITAVYGASFNTQPSWTWDPPTITFFPSFEFVSNGWALVPTTTDSGVSISGAQAFCNDLFASSTGIGASIANGMCVVGGFLFIPNSDSVQQFKNIPTLAGESFPFSWLGQMRAILEASQASSTDNFIDLNLPLGSSTAALGFTNLDVISTSTISKYLPDSTRSSIKDLLTATFWLLGAAFLYRTLHNIWQTT